jgi:hypothetical protein
MFIAATTRNLQSSFPAARISSVTTYLTLRRKGAKVLEGKMHLFVNSFAFLKEILRVLCVEKDLSKTSP